MNTEPQHFTVMDARTFEGDPFEVAERACQQAAAVVGIAYECATSAETMACNSFMERNLQKDSNSPRASEWDGTPEGKRFATIKQQLNELSSALRALAKASGYNPKRPPTA